MSPDPSPPTAPTALRGDGGRAAPPLTRVLAQARFETGTLLRNGEQLLIAIVLPALALVALVYAPVPGLGDGARVDVAMPGVLALAVISTAFTGQAIQTGFDRRYGVLRLIGTTPVGRGGLLQAKALAVLAVEVIQFVALGALGVALGWRPDPLGLAVAVPFWLLGTWAFVALALLLGGVLRAEAVLALANLVWVLLLGAGGVVVPPRAAPPAAAAVIELLPSAGLGDGLRAALASGTFDVRAALVVLVWAVGASLLAVRAFRWSD